MKAQTIIEVLYIGVSIVLLMSIGIMCIVGITKYIKEYREGLKESKRNKGIPNS